MEAGIRSGNSVGRLGGRAMMTPLGTRHRFTHVLAALSAGTLFAVAATSERAWARDSMAQAAAQAGAAGDRCSSIPPGFGHPPPQVFSPTLQVLQRSVEPVLATDGLIHLAYAALVTNTLAQPVQIVERRAGRSARRLQPDRAQPHHRPAGPRRRRQGQAVSRRRTTTCRPTRRSGNPCLASRRACRPAIRG